MKPYHVRQREGGFRGVLLRAESPEAAVRAWAERRATAEPVIVDVYALESLGPPLGVFRVERTVKVTPVTS